MVIIKLQSEVQTSVLGLGVDFVLPLSQQQQEEQEEQEEEPPPKLEFDTKDQVLCFFVFSEEKVQDKNVPLLASVYLNLLSNESLQLPFDKNIPKIQVVPCLFTRVLGVYKHLISSMISGKIPLRNC